MDREELLGQLSTADQSVWFVVLIVAAVILSLRATMIQREGVCAQLEGERGDTREVYPLRHTANSLVVGALGFFLCLAIKAWREAGQSDCVDARSAHANLWAAMLVLAAAMIRYEDVEFNHANGRI